MSTQASIRNASNHYAINRGNSIVYEVTIVMPGTALSFTLVVETCFQNARRRTSTSKLATLMRTQAVATRH